jgi:D-threo-aldose 1-dehydrogenase
VKPPPVDPLKKVPLAGSELQVGRVVFGTAPLASVFWNTEAQTAIAAVTRGIERGIRTFDTAPFYGLGESERRLGAAISATPSDELVIATKAGRLLVAGEDGSTEAVFDFGHDATLRSMEASMDRLGVDRINIVHIHDPDDHIDEALEGTVPALTSLRDAGSIDAISVGTNAVNTAAVFLERANLDAVMVAGRYTLLDQSARPLIERCAQHGVAFLAAGVFNSGVLARPVDGAWYDYAPAEAHIVNRVRAIEKVCAQHGATLRTAALQFPFTNPDVTSVVVGMAAPEEVDDNLFSLTDLVPEDLWADLIAHSFIAAQ